MTSPFLGMVQSFAFGFAPKGWVQCNGQLMSIQQNAALFALLGTTYGGNGVNTFGLPDLRSRTPMSFGQSYPQGQMAGEENHTLTLAEMPSHNHLIQGNTTTGSTNTPASNAALANGTGAGSPGPFDVKLFNSAQPSAKQWAGSIGNSGGSQSHSNLQPYLTINWCIAVSGIFPSRG